ncbi:putative metallo-beta-lactamase domain protein [Aspergillus costaricaensis CBS 115574]|uniref:Metallo-beta-lactamase domain protein n=1 Tax=Aspergillus costaricaensis CBS 115574 TaxID=1448317 RepID=A0ACD1IKT9_9EURO|nr:putative metallo-beta-lactamase domain protein [Aspergillus costaricaensis CBS 115574]RAK90883.1 putative metallo-beta-lactamase domain protein [Aspergillus costaricaensis CBS 115574]
MGLDYKVFTSRRPGVSRTTPAGHDHLKWVPTTSTLIFGQRDAVLVDTQLTMAAAKDLVDWVVGTGKNLTTIYITHAHGDHFYGTSAILERFPDAKVVATPETIPNKLVIATPLEQDHFMLENERLEVVRLGHTDTDDTTALWVPAIGLVVAGDAVYNNTHPYLGESKSQEARSRWVAALDKIAALQPRIVVGGHSDPSKEFSPDAVQTTKEYLNDFARLDRQTSTPEELYSQMMELHPTRLNVGSLWGGATLVKK